MSQLNKQKIIRLQSLLINKLQFLLNTHLKKLKFMLLLRRRPKWNTSHNNRQSIMNLHSQLLLKIPIPIRSRSRFLCKHHDL